MKLKNILILTTIALAGCNKHTTLEVGYETEQEAVVAFLKDNRGVLKSLTPSQEMLGWVLEYDGLYYNTTPFVGELSNQISTEDIGRPSDYKVVGNIHTHPVPPKGMNCDFFSREDLKASEQWHMYLLSQENCNVRFASNTHYRSGTLLGKIEDCK